MKKRYVMIVGTMLLCTTLFASTTIGEKKPTICGKGTTMYLDELDQNQSAYIEGLMMPIGRIVFEETIIMVQVAQSFIPTKELLTRVELYAAKNVTASSPLVVGIRDNLTHGNLVEISIPPGAFNTGNFSWVECNFNDIWVTPGKTYYIVTKTKNVTDNLYVWAANNNSNAYPNGCAWVSIDNGSSWNESVTQNQELQSKMDVQYPAPLDRDDTGGDMCFRTYGLREATLAITTGGTFLKPSFLVKNAGNITAFDLKWKMTITGGILNLINKTTNGTQVELVANDTIPIPTVSVFGLGPLLITVTVSAVNAQEVILTKHAVIILFFIILR
jgi:hypothetical protein